MDLINACAPVEDTDEFRGKVEAARENYDALTADQKELFPAGTLKVLTDDEAIIPVMDEIDAIGTPENTQVFRDKVASARENYNALSDDQKDIFPEDVLKKLKDYEAIVFAMDKVNTIGAVEYTGASKDLIDEARKAYYDLSDYQKALFPADVLKALEHDEKAYGFMDRSNDMGTPENTEHIGTELPKRETLTTL